MKKVVAISLIFVMSAQCFYQLGLITYFQANRAYIAEFLCINKDKPASGCNGHCYLKKNLQLAGDTQVPAAPSSQNKEKSDVPVFLITEHSIEIQLIGRSSIHSSPVQNFLSADHRAALLRPPAVA